MVRPGQEEPRGPAGGEAPEEAPTTPLCTYEKKIAGPAPVPVIEKPDPEKTRAVVESVA